MPYISVISKQLNHNKLTQKFFKVSRDMYSRKRAFGVLREESIWMDQFSPGNICFHLHSDKPSPEEPNTFSVRFSSELGQ